MNIALAVLWHILVTRRIREENTPPVACVVLARREPRGQRVPRLEPGNEDDQPVRASVRFTGKSGNRELALNG